MVKSQDIYRYMQVENYLRFPKKKKRVEYHHHNPFPMMSQCSWGFLKIVISRSRNLKEVEHIAIYFNDIYTY